MRELIRARYPDHGILGEESGLENGGAEHLWTLDPIDGTAAFVTACPLFGTLIALLHRGQPLLGLIHQPLLRQLCLGDGTTTTLNGRPAHVRAARPAAGATLLTSTVWTAYEHRDGAAFESLARTVRRFRTWGDCYGYLLVATGWADIMLDPIVNQWDVAPVIPIIRGAGGAVSDWYGGDPVGADSIVATTSPALHEEVVRRLNPAA